MQAANNIAIMQNTFAFMRSVLIFPPVQEIHEPGSKYFLKIFLLCLSTSLFLIASLSHIVLSFIRHMYENMGLDLAFAISIFGCYIYNSAYLRNLKNTLNIYRMLSDFETYGKPDTFDKSNKNLNKMSVFRTVVLFTLLLGFAISACFQIGRCRKQNVGRNIDEICSVLGGVWLPFNLMGGPFKYVFYCYQMYSLFACYLTADTVNFSVVEVVEHINIRFQHVTTKFFEALNEKDLFTQRQKFNKAVRYHVDVMELVNMLNESYGSCFFVHAFLTGAILGCFGQGILKSIEVGPVSLLTGWVISVAISCTSGQRLTDEGSSLGEALYSFNWVGVNKQIQKDIVVVLLRCQRPIGLQVRPIGTMNFSMIVAILKTSYSYITFLSQTS